MESKVKDVLLTVLPLKQKELLQCLVGYLNSIGRKTKSNGKWIYHRGTYPVMLVAHLDTVHRTMPTEDTIYYSKDGNVLNCPDGIGGDDRCGVAIILELIRRTGIDFSVLFTTDEEIGAVGASDFVNTRRNLRNVNAIVEYDRRGSDDVVRYYDGNLELTEIAEKYGFIRNTGSFSDIVELSDGFGVSSINISSGYYNEHSHYETINISVMESIIERSINMFTTEKFDKKIEYTESYCHNIYGGVYGYGTYDYSGLCKHYGIPVASKKLSVVGSTHKCSYCDSTKEVAYFPGYGYLCEECAEEMGLYYDDYKEYIY